MIMMMMMRMTLLLDDVGDADNLDDDEISDVLFAKSRVGGGGVVSLELDLRNSSDW
jgi:hypothetical protein